MSIVAVIRKMLDEGIELDAALKAAEFLERREAEPSKDALRMRRLRAERRERDEVGERPRTNANSPPPAGSMPLDLSTTAQPTPKAEDSRAAPQKKAPETARELLETVLDVDNAERLIQYWPRRTGHALTLRDGKLLARKLAEWHNPNEAADAIIRFRSQHGAGSSRNRGSTSAAAPPGAPHRGPPAPARTEVGTVVKPRDRLRVESEMSGPAAIVGGPLQRSRWRRRGKSACAENEQQWTVFASIAPVSRTFITAKRRTASHVFEPTNGRCLVEEHPSGSSSAVEAEHRARMPTVRTGRCIDGGPEPQLKRGMSLPQTEKMPAGS
jgi:hypothetical protein